MKEKGKMIKMTPFFSLSPCSQISLIFLSSSASFYSLLLIPLSLGFFLAPSYLPLPLPVFHQHASFISTSSFSLVPCSPFSFPSFIFFLHWHTFLLFYFSFSVFGSFFQYLIFFAFKARHLSMIYPSPSLHSTSSRLFILFSAPLVCTSFVAATLRPH